METRIARRKPFARLHTGDLILANAQAVPIKAVKTSFDAFAEVHRSYTEAQRTVDTMEQALEERQAQTAQLDADQDDALEALAVSLVNDGEPRTRPFGRFANQSPARLKGLPLDEEVKGIQALVTALQREKALSPATQAAAQTALAAAQKVETALPPLLERRSQLKAARSVRDTIAQKWDTYLSALRLAVRGAAATAVPGMYTALFGRGTRPSKKAKDTPAAAAVAPRPAAQATPPASESSSVA